MLCYCSHCCKEEMTTKYFVIDESKNPFWLCSTAQKRILKMPNIPGKKIRCTSRHAMFTHKLSPKKKIVALLVRSKKMSRKKSFWSTEICLFYTSHKICLFRETLCEYEIFVCYPTKNSEFFDILICF
jgi:hypothetical protein